MKPATVFSIVFIAIILIVQAKRTSVRKTKIIKAVSTTTPLYRPQEERPFPKNTMRFFVTPQPFDSKNNELRLNIQTKKPLMEKFIVKERRRETIDKVPVTRRPLMKAIGSVLDHSKSKNIASNNHVIKEREISYSLQNKVFALHDTYAEEATDIYDELLFSFSLLGQIIENNRRNCEIRMSEENKIPDSSHPAEEVDDHNEFIFVKNEKSDDLADSLPYAPEDYATTTELFEDESMLRPKRYVNIIEEENQPTTISGFVYTNRDLKLSNEVPFKNINA